MWNIKGHEILFGGGPYDFDSEDPMVMVHCLRCPDGSTRGWKLWYDRNESGRVIEPFDVGVVVVAKHLRDCGVDVPETLEKAAAFMAVMQNDAKEGLYVLSEAFIEPRTQGLSR